MKITNCIKKILLLVLLFINGLIYAGEVSTDMTAEFDIKSRTSFGIDLDNPYKYGLKQELADFNLKLHLTPYQKLSNLVNSTSAVGFIKMTFFNLDLMTNEDLGYNAGVPDQKAFLMRNRFQTGEFIAGIAWQNWVFQFNAGANEPFWSPWNKGIEFTNDKIKFSWAYLDSVVDIKRTKKVTELKPQDEVVTQFQQDGCGATDQFGMNVTGSTIAALYNKEDLFGLNLKFATEYSYDSESISVENKNGIAAGFDYVITPSFLQGLKILSSVGGSFNYGKDENADPIIAGTKVGYRIPLNDDISIEPYVGFDGGIRINKDNGMEPFEYEAAAGLTMHWQGQAGWFTDYILNKDGRVFPGMSLAWSMYGISDNSKEKNNSVKFTLFEPRSDDGIFYKIGSEMIVDVTNIGQDSWTCMTTLYFDYTIPGAFKTSGNFVPCLTICYDNLPYSSVGNTDYDERDNAMKLDVGIKLENVISNTMMGIFYDSGNLIKDKSDILKGYLKTVIEIQF